MITAIHIDDDSRSLDLMKIAIKDIEGIVLKQSFASGDDAAHWLKANHADLIFLDIEMPGRNGIDFAEEFGELAAGIIFVTAHTGFAIKAFEACALDYLVKPVYTEKIQHAIDRYLLRKQKEKKNLNDTSGSLKDQIQELFQNYMSAGSYPRRVFITMVGETRVINLAEVIYFGASGAYTKIFLSSGETVLCSDSIKSYSEYLENHPDFVRIHRSYLVNKQFVRAIIRKDGNAFVRMSNDDQLSISQQRKAEILLQIAG